MVPEMVIKEIPSKLCLFWEDTPKFIADLQSQYANIKDFKEKVHYNPNDPHNTIETKKPKNDAEQDIVDKYKELQNLMECGFYVFNKLSSKDPKIFTSASPAFHKASAINLREFSDSKQGQNTGMEFLANINYTDDDCRALIDNDLVITMFETKLEHPYWNQYGLNSEKVLLKLCRNTAFINKLKDRNAYRVVVAA